MSKKKEYCMNCKTLIIPKKMKESDDKTCPLCNIKIATPKYVRDWEELKLCESETHYLEIKDCCGWVRPKIQVSKEDYYKHNQYLSTHTFYGGTHKSSTELLQSLGFNVVLANWDEIGL